MAGEVATGTSYYEREPGDQRRDLAEVGRQVARRPPALALGPEVREDALDEQVLLDRLAQPLLGLLDDHARIEDGLLDLGVGRERVGEEGEDLDPLLARALLEGVEQAAHLPVLLEQQLDGVRGLSEEVAAALGRPARPRLLALGLTPLAAVAPAPPAVPLGPGSRRLASGQAAFVRAPAPVIRGERASAAPPTEAP